MNDHFELPETFDPSAHEGTKDLECIPIGWYQAQMVENEIRDAKNGNGRYLLAVFEILDGEYRGRKVYQNITLQNDNQQAVEIGQRLLTDIYTAIGHTTPTRDTRVMLFKPVMARVGIKRDKDGVYPDRNCVTSVRPAGFPAEAWAWRRSIHGTGHAPGADVAAHAGNAGGGSAVR